MQDDLLPLLALADDHLILGQRTAEMCGKGPSLEEEMALANIGLDFIGQARALLTEVGKREGAGRTEDDLAFVRPEHGYRNLQLVELPNEDFAHVQAKILAFSALMVPYWEAACSSRDAALAGIAGQALKESVHHRRHSAEWVIRLGDGTEESRDRMTDALETVWPFCGELFEMTEPERRLAADQILPDRAALREPWQAAMAGVLERATLATPDLPMHQTGGRSGRHTEYMGHLLAVMQALPRAHPGATW